MRDPHDTRVPLDRTTARIIGWTIVVMMPLIAWSNKESSPLADPANALLMGMGLGLLLVAYLPPMSQWRQVRLNPLPASIASMAVMSAIAQLVSAIA